jgi:hypothetical protein
MAQFFNLRHFMTKNWRRMIELRQKKGRNGRSFLFEVLSKYYYPHLKQAATTIGKTAVRTSFSHRYLISVFSINFREIC